MSGFASLHCHTERSPIDSVARIEEYLERAKEVGVSAVATTEHGRLSGFRDNQAAQEKHGMKVIQGIETYFSSTDRFDRRSNKQRDDGSSVYNHLILLAMNNKGLRNLNKMNEIAWTEGFYNQARIDKELLEKYGDDVIVLSGCMSGVMAEGILNDNMQKAYDWAGWFKEQFGDRFFVELQSENDIELNTALLKVADDLSIKSVLTEDSHMVRPSDRWIEEAFLVLSTKPNADKSVKWESLPKDMPMLEKFNALYPGRKMTFEHLDLFMAGREHRENKLKLQGIDRPELFDNTVDIANLIEGYDNPTNLDLLPRPKAEDPVIKFRQMCRRGMKQKGLAGDPVAEARLKHELNVIEAKNLSSYHLIVADMMNWITAQGMQKGFGRGSAGGSLANYVSNITEINPLEDDLLFERYLDPSRDDPADIDSDTSDQAAVLGYLTRMYNHVAKITTVNYFKEKSSLKDACSIIKVPFAEANKALKNIESFEDYLEDPSLAEFRSKYPDVFKIASEFNGRIRGYGMHASGVVVSNKDFTDFMPIESRPAGKDERVPVVAYDGNEVAEIGAYKIDVLGVKTLAVINDCINLIAKRHGINIIMREIPRDDYAVFQGISEGYTRGLFQAEQSASTKLIVEMGVDNFDDLVVSNALVRTGAYKAFGKEYIARKRGKRKVKSIHPIYDEITKKTLGLPLYQETWMKIMNEFAGMDMGDVNKVRKLTAKKKSAEELAPYREKFISGVVANADMDTAEFLWDWLLKTSEYLFNKSHAVAYSRLTNATAWLKHYYPLEYMLSLLRNEEDKDAITDYFIEAKRLGIKILLPHVNKSKSHHEIEGDSIRIGLSSIKYLSDLTAPKVLRYAPYKNYKELYDKVMEKNNGLNVRLLQGLNAIGAASFEDNPPKGNERDNLYEYLQIPAFNSSELMPKIRYQMDSIEDIGEQGIYKILAMVRGVKNGDGWTRVDLVDESGSIGLFTNTALVQGQMYVVFASGSNIVSAIPIEDVLNKVRVPMVEYLYRDEFPNMGNDDYKVIAWESRKTKAGKNMATVVMSDSQKELTSALVFDRTFLQMYSMCKPGNVIQPTLGRMKDNTLTLNDCRVLRAVS